MKIEFNDKSYIECYASNQPGKIIFAISAYDSLNPLKKITNAVELTLEEFHSLISEVK